MGVTGRDGAGYRTSLIRETSHKPKILFAEDFFCAPTEIRTPVLTLKGLCPGPLDDGGKFSLLRQRQKLYYPRLIRSSLAEFPEGMSLHPLSSKHG